MSFEELKNLKNKASMLLLKIRIMHKNSEIKNHLSTNTSGIEDQDTMHRQK